MSDKPSVRITQASSANVVQFPERKAPSREFKRRQHAYVVKVRADKEFPSSAKIVCWVVSEHWNETSGDAFLSTDTIAAEGGISQTNVRNMLKHPRMPEHMRIERGQRGSGHSNRYWPIEQTGALSTEEPKEQFSAKKEQFSPIKEQTGAMNHSNHSAASAARSADADRVAQNLDQKPDRLRSRGQAALNVPYNYNDPGYIEFGDTPTPHLHPTSVYASS